MDSCICFMGYRWRLRPERMPTHTKHTAGEGPRAVGRRHRPLARSSFYDRPLRQCERLRVFSCWWSGRMAQTHLPSPVVFILHTSCCTSDSVIPSPKVQAESPKIFKPSLLSGLCCACSVAISIKKQIKAPGQCCYFPLCWAIARVSTFIKDGMENWSPCSLSNCRCVERLPN